MATTFKLKVITPEETALESSAEHAKVQGTVGELGILPSHTPTLITLKAGEMTVRIDEETTNVYFVPEGIAHITENDVTILSPYLEELSTIDKTRAQTAKERAQKRLKDADKAIDKARAKQSLDRAEARLTIAL